MKRAILVALLMLLVASASAQDVWNYVGEVKFPSSDTALVRPYFCTVTSEGRVYVVSSSVYDASGYNAIYYADSNDTEMKVMVNYTLRGDTDTLTGDIAAVRGIGSVGTDVLVNSSSPYPRSAPNTVAVMYYYPEGDTGLVQKFGYWYGSSGHGTYIHGVTLSKDTIAYTGSSYLTTVRCYNFRYGLSTPARGSYIPPPSYGQEPGGPNTGGFDVVRDCALIPGGNYDDTNTPWYTSRNSLSSSQPTGGIAAWTGATQTNPGTYAGTRVQDLYGALALGPSISYGITVDKNAYLWVAGNDTSRRWVKAFDMSGGVFASEVYELPAQFSQSQPDPNGAPMLNPVDVALDGNATTAYVPDASQRVVHKFKFGPPAGVNDERTIPFKFALEQNYPNPFNPTTTVSFTLPKASHVKLTVTNLLGQEVATLVDDQLPAGKHVKLFKGDNLSSGTYFYTLQFGGQRLTKKMMLVR